MENREIIRKNEVEETSRKQRNCSKNEVLTQENVTQRQLDDATH